MRRAAMCFLLSQFPRCRVHTLANSWWQSFHHISRISTGSISSNVFASDKHGLEDRCNSTDNRQTQTKKAEGKNKPTFSRKTTIRHEILDETTKPKVDICNVEIAELGSSQYVDIRQSIAANKDSAERVTIIMFDIETTGFSPERHRIIEIALRGLDGGENSTFQTLVNPGESILNSDIHGITDYMVKRPEVPSMKELIPILLRYMESRRKPGGHVMLVAHNARLFDVPFLLSEFSRCGYDMPSDVLFGDTLPLARQVKKSGGPNAPAKIKLQVLGEHYDIPPAGTAHRAMADVNMLAQVFQHLTHDLKLEKHGFIKAYSFCASQVKKKPGKI